VACSGRAYPNIATRKTPQASSSAYRFTRKTGPPAAIDAVVKARVVLVARSRDVCSRIDGPRFRGRAGFRDHGPTDRSALGPRSTSESFLERRFCVLPGLREVCGCTFIVTIAGSRTPRIGRPLPCRRPLCGGGSIAHAHRHRRRQRLASHQAREFEGDVIAAVCMSAASQRSNFWS